MAISVPPYEETKFSAITKVVRWCQNKLNMRDWEITVDYGERPPVWEQNAEDGRMGSCTSNRDYFFGWIWISPERCKEHDVHPALAVMHEMLHLYFANNNVNSNEEERMCNTFGSILFKVWGDEQKKKKRKKK